MIDKKRDISIDEESELWDATIDEEHCFSANGIWVHNSITDVFKASITKAYFETQALEDMGYDVMPPIKQDIINTFNNVVRVYKPTVEGRSYLVFTDHSDGVGDPFVQGVMYLTTGAVFCSAAGRAQRVRGGGTQDNVVG